MNSGLDGVRHVEESTERIGGDVRRRAVEVQVEEGFELARVLVDREHVDGGIARASDVREATQRVERQREWTERNRLGQVRFDRQRAIVADAVEVDALGVELDRVQATALRVEVRVVV